MNLTALLADIRLQAVAPELTLAATLAAVLLLDAFRREPERNALSVLALLGIAAAAVAAYGMPSGGRLWFGGLVVADGLRQAVALIVPVAAVLAVIAARTYAERVGLKLAECLALLLTSTIGMTMLAATTHLGLMFLALEMLSVPLYAMTALRSGDGRGAEAAIKYFLMGGAVGAMFLLGTALSYAASGSLTLDGLAASGPLQALAVALVVLALAFKLAWVPLQAWSPDAYEGAPAPVTAFMSTAVKVAVLGAALRIWAAVGGALDLTSVAAALAVASMVLGNLLAVVQTNLKRMLAYSSIAHAGYLGLALVVPGPQATAAALYYALVYTLMNGAVFALLVALAKPGAELESLDDLRGLAKRRGGAAFALLLLMASLSGMPPLAGFTAKLMLFAAAVSGGAIALAIVAVLTSVVGAYYYLRPVVLMYLSEGPDAVGDEPAPLLWTTIAVVCVLLVLLGVAPGAILKAAATAAAALAFGG